MFSPNKQFGAIQFAYVSVFRDILLRALLFGPVQGSHLEGEIFIIVKGKCKLRPTNRKNSKSRPTHFKVKFIRSKLRPTLFYDIHLTLSRGRSEG